MARIFDANNATVSKLGSNNFFRFLVVGAMLLVAFMIFAPFVIVNTGYRGVKLTFGKAANEPVGEGLNFVLPLVQSVYKMPVMIERSETQSDAASKDLQRVNTTVVLNYHIDPLQVVKVYRDLGKFENVEPRIVDPAVQEAVKAITALYTAEHLVTKRQTVADEIRVKLTERLSRHALIIDEFSIVNFHFSESFDEAIEAKTVAEQQKLKAERDLERIKVEAEQRIASARAEAESSKLNAEAQAQGLRIQREALTPELIELRRVEAQIKAIEKWNGVLPTMTGSTIPFIQVEKPAK